MQDTSTFFETKKANEVILWVYTALLMVDIDFRVKNAASEWGMQVFQASSMLIDKKLRSSLEESSIYEFLGRPLARLRA